MFAFFVSCAVLGGVLLVAQLVLAGVDFGGESELHPSGHHEGLGHTLGHGLDLFSARSVTAGVAFFGVAGAGAMRSGLGATLATGLGVGAGLLAMLAVAWIMSQLLRLEDDGTVRVERAIGAPATVYLAIPGAKAGAGKITLTLQGRTVEYQAVTAGAPLPTGSPVVVVDVVAPGTLEVAAHPEVGV